jgi:hypothetical protein
VAPRSEASPHTIDWDAIHNLVAKRLLRLRRQLIAYKLLIIVDRVRYRRFPAARRMNVSVGLRAV